MNIKPFFMAAFTAIFVISVFSGCVPLPNTEKSLESPPATTQPQSQQTVKKEVDESGPPLTSVPGKKESENQQTDQVQPETYEQQIQVKYVPKPDTVKVMTEALATGKPILLEFGAVWCGPCKELKPIIEELKGTYSDRIVFLTIDVDDPDGSKLADEFKVRYVPDISVFNSAHYITAHFGGFADKVTLENAIKAALGGN